MNQTQKEAYRKKALAKLAAAFNVQAIAHEHEAKNLIGDFNDLSENELERSEWLKLTPLEATNDFDYQFCHANDVIPDQMRSFSGFKKAALMILVSDEFDGADYEMARQHLKYAQHIDIGANHWPALLQSMKWLYYGTCPFCIEPLIDFLAMHGWEWTGVTSYNQLLKPEGPITQPAAA